MKQFEHKVLTGALWIAGPAIAYLALPIEGEFWASLMPEGNHLRAYALCLGLDIVGELLIYFFSRIQQTERKGSKRHSASWGILAFSGVTVVASWGVAFQQLLKVADMPLIVAALNALIQPVTQLGVGYTQAVLEGKFDGAQPARTEQPPEPARAQPEPEPDQSAPTEQDDAPVAATIEQWREIARSLNGKRATIDADGVLAELDAHGLPAPSASTVRRWATKTRRDEL